MSHSNRTIQSNINNPQSTHDKQQPKNNLPESRQEHIQRTVTNIREDSNKIKQGENCVKQGMGEQSGSQIDSHINRPHLSYLANMSGGLKKSYGQLPYFHKRNTFSCNICVTG